MRQGNHHPNEPSKPSKGAFEDFEGSQGESFSWSQPKPLSSGLLKVASFDDEFLPRSIAPWVLDISERMQCPPDFVAASAMVGLSAALG
jgi:putative DNA primase/helicase